MIRSSASSPGHFVSAVLRRFRAADGTSHTRALAYQSIFILLSGYIGLIGLASLLGVEELRGVVQELGRSVTPGPGGRLLQEAARSGAHGGGVAAALGLGAALAGGTLTMAQLERSGNRLAGSDEDRPAVRRYVVALVLAVLLGVPLTIGALILGGGSALAAGLGWTDGAEAVWTVVRWPAGVLVVALAIYLLFRFGPRRRLGPARAILIGTLIAVALWVAFTGMLALYFSRPSSSPYGPLLAIVALLVWSMLTSLALHLGMATTCELAAAPTGVASSSGGAVQGRRREAASASRT